jgi:hypothetical protein
MDLRSYDKLSVQPESMSEINLKAISLKATALDHEARPLSGKLVRRKQLKSIVVSSQGINVKREELMRCK